MLHPDEFDMRAEVSKKEDEIKGWNGSVPIKQSIASRDLDAVRKTLNSVARLDNGAVMQSGMSNARGMTQGWLAGRHAAGQASDLLVREAARLGL